MHADTDVARTTAPKLRYREVAAAIDWLCRAFGFEPRLIEHGADGCVRYAELIFGDGMIVLGSAAGSNAGGATPSTEGGAERETCYVFVEDAGTHCAKARQAGAEIVREVGGDGPCAQGYSCRDPEGHLWNFGTYNPWRQEPNKESGGPSTAHSGGRAPRRQALGMGLATTLLAFAGLAWVPGVGDPNPLDIDPPAHAAGGSSQLRPPPAAGALWLKDLSEELTQERSAREAAERAALEARELLVKKERDATSTSAAAARAAREHAAFESAERIVQETREQLALVEQAAGQAREQLDEERAARTSSERLAREAVEELARERAAKEAAERSARETRDELSRVRNVRRAPRRRLLRASGAYFWY
jgi:uncharacterized glyoxalase superfamily protein PhnB